MAPWLTPRTAGWTLMLLAGGVGIVVGANDAFVCMAVLRQNSLAENRWALADSFDRVLSRQQQPPRRCTEMLRRRIGCTAIAQTGPR